MYVIFNQLDTTTENFTPITHKKKNQKNLKMHNVFKGNMKEYENRLSRWKKKKSKKHNDFEGNLKVSKNPQYHHVSDAQSLIEFYHHHQSI